MTNKDTYNGTDETTYNASPDHNKDTLKEMDYRNTHLFAIEILKKNVGGMLMIKDIVPVLQEIIEQTRKEERDSIVEIIVNKQRFFKRVADESGEHTELVTKKDIINNIKG